MSIRDASIPALIYLQMSVWILLRDSLCNMDGRCKNIRKQEVRDSQENTEEHTFELLKRIPFSQLVNEARESESMTTEERNAWFEARGWTRSDWIACTMGTGITGYD